MCAWGGGEESTSAWPQKVGIAAGRLFLASNYLIVNMHLFFLLNQNVW